MEDKEQQLIDRLNGNLAEYHDYLMSLDKKELIEMSGLISAMSDAHFYLTECHVFEPHELEYLLQFQNPLEVIADKWGVHREDISDFLPLMDEELSSQDALKGGYALVTETELPGDMVSLFSKKEEKKEEKLRNE